MREEYLFVKNTCILCGHLFSRIKLICRLVRLKHSSEWILLFSKAHRHRSKNGRSPKKQSINI